MSLPSIILVPFGLVALLMGAHWTFTARASAKEQGMATTPFLMQGVIAILLGLWALYSAFVH